MAKKNWNYFFLLLICLIVFPGKSSALLSGECLNIDYVSRSADIIAYGQVVDVEWREKEGITNSYIKILSYFKGSGDKEIVIKSRGCGAGDACLLLDSSGRISLGEDEAGFAVGETGFLYLNKEGLFYRSVCGRGISNIAPLLSPFGAICAVIVIIFILLALKMFNKKQKKEGKIN